MRVEALALLGRYAGADRRSGLVPPVPARSCVHTAARASTWQWHPGCRHRRIPQRPSDGTGGRNGPLATRPRQPSPAFTPATSDCQFYIRSIIALRHSSVRRARRKWMRPSEEAHAVMRSAYDVRRETRVQVPAPHSASLGTPEF